MTKWYYTSKLGLPSNQFLISADGESNYIIVSESAAKELVNKLNQYEDEVKSYMEMFHSETCTHAGCWCWGAEEE